MPNTFDEIDAMMAAYEERKKLQKAAAKQARKEAKKKKGKPHEPFYDMPPYKPSKHVQELWDAGWSVPDAPRVRVTFTVGNMEEGA